VVIKSGLWYTVSNFLSKGILFLATPLFTRLLTKEEFGSFNNFSSWLSIFIIIVTLNLDSSLISARYDYEDKLDKYVYSMMGLSTLSTAVWALVFNIFMAPISEFLELKPIYINLIFLYLLLFPALQLFQANERFMFRYKTSSALSLLSSVGATLLSLVLVIYMDENKLDGRIFGHIIPTAVVGLALFIVIAVRGKSIDFSMWKYALAVCLPYIPHLLSMMVLSSTDRIMITKMCGEEDAALYSVVYTVAMIVTLLMNALNGAYSPWLAGKLAKREFAEIRKTSKGYMLLFLVFSLGIMLMSPEVLLIMGGEDYMSAKPLMIPIMLGCMCQFLYTTFVNVEQFYKKTIGMAFASVSAAVLNLVLNFIFIPMVGYEAAAYTTLIGYLWLLMFHMLLVKNINGTKIYSYRFVFAILGVMALLSVGVFILFKSDTVRYIFIGIYVAAILTAMWKYKSKIISLLKK